MKVIMIGIKQQSNLDFSKSEALCFTNGGRNEYDFAYIVPRSGSSAPLLFSADWPSNCVFMQVSKSSLTSLTQIKELYKNFQENVGTLSFRGAYTDGGLDRQDHEYW